MRTLLLLQGSYYFLTAVWPLIHLRSFEMVTGDKKDHWLVYTLSLMILSSSLVFLFSSIYLPIISKAVVLLSVTNCLFLGFVSIYFPLKGVIRKVYLGDGLLEMLILTGVLYVEFRE